MKNREFIYKLTCIFLIIDQLIKLIISHTLKEFQSITIIKNFFNITYVKNTGAAFSILENKSTLLIIISIIFIILLDKYIKKQKEYNTLTALSFGLIMGGIFGNLLDRIMYHSVIDFLDFNIFNYSFPIFNIADICITVGIMLFALITLFEKDDKNDRRNTKGNN